MNLVTYFHKEAGERRNGNVTAVQTPGRSMSYEELFTGVRRCAGMILDARIGQGERVALLASDSPEWIVAFLGVIGAGSITVPLGTLLQDHEITSILADAQPAALILSDDLRERWERIASRFPFIQQTFIIGGQSSSGNSFQDALQAAEEREPIESEDSDPAFIFYTSGSTGKPKGALHAHQDVHHTVERFSRDVLNVTHADRIYSSSKLYFAYGLGNSLSFTLANGATSLLMDARPRPELIAKIFTELRPTIYCGVPATFRGLAEFVRGGGALDCSSLRVCVSAGEALPASLFHEWKETTGLDTIDAIGSTEMLHMFISNRMDRIVPGSSGFPLSEYDARLTSYDGTVIDGAGSGDLYVRGGSCMLGYWQNEEKTRETISDGWVKTGDVYRRDEQGAYFFEGRSDDVFKVKGLWVSPLEIESALLTHPDVREAAVVAAYNSDRLAETVAYVVHRDGEVSEEVAEQLRAHARTVLPGYKCPAVIRFVAELPRTPTGKVQRFKLREREKEHRESAPGGSILTA